MYIQSVGRLMLSFVLRYHQHTTAVKGRDLNLCRGKGPSAIMSSIQLRANLLHLFIIYG
jgi:hypothetical protein